MVALVHAGIHVFALITLLWIAAAPAAAQEAGETWVLTGARIYPSPDAARIDNGVVIVRDGRIAAVGSEDEVKAPQHAPVSQCSGGVITAGFHNGHVHFTGEEFADARRKPAAELSNALTAMLTRYGYSTVVDTASDPDNTLALRARIESGELHGPRILTVGWPLFPPQGLPAYISHLPSELLRRLPQPESTQAAVAQIDANMKAGMDATKLFLATPQGDGSLKRMPADIARAAAAESHRHGKMVLVHPTDIAGVRAALDARADVLVHTTLGSQSPWPADLLREALQAGVTIAPTLKLLSYELKKENVPDDVARGIVERTVEHFSEFAAAGGRVIFGTDVGYMTDFDPTAEYELLAQAGLSPMQILASLTTTPATLWKEDARRGALRAGMDADIVVLNADPASDPRNFANVRCTFRAGKPIFRAAPP